jgi:hypothetical protein
MNDATSCFFPRLLRGVNVAELNPAPHTSAAAQISRGWPALAVKHAVAKTRRLDQGQGCALRVTVACWRDVLDVRCERTMVSHTLPSVAVTFEQGANTGRGGGEREGEGGICAPSPPSASKSRLAKPSRDDAAAALPTGSVG